MKFPRAGIVFLIIIISASSFNFSGCSAMGPVGDYFGQRYVNMVSYFNTFYNAKKLFDEAVTELEDAERRHRQQQRQAQFEVPQQTKQKFNSVIEKCSRLLHQHPTSKYADNAVLMIGQSYYYMRQNVQAERKFLELLAEFPDSRYVYEAQLLLAKSQRRMNKHTEAQVALQNLVERLEDSRRDANIVAQARIELGDIEKREGNLNQAIREFRSAVETARNRELQTEARFRLANVFFEQGEYDKAYVEYVNVVNDRPSNTILFEAQRARARILAMSEEYEQAIDLLEDLLTDLRLTEYISRIEIEAAHIYRNKGAYDKAIDQYVYVDTTHARTPVSTEAQYSLATIYKNTFGDFVNAKTYYERVSRATPPSDLTRSAWAINDQLTRYKKYRDEIARLDSVIAGQRYELRAAEERIAMRESISSDTSSTAVDDTLEVQNVTPDEIKISPEELRSKIASNTDALIRNYADLAGLFYMEMERPDSAIHYYTRLVYNFPESSQAPLALYALGELIRVADEEGYTASGMNYLFDEQFSSAGNEEQRNAIYNLLIERYPDTEFATEAKRILGMEIHRTETDPMEEVYLQAEKELTAGNYENALHLFGYIVDKNSESEYTVKACYAIGWVYENIFMKPDSAIVYYTTITENYSNTQFASAVQGKVNAWNQQIAEVEKKRIEEETAAEMPDTTDIDAEIAPEFIDERLPEQRGIPIPRPTDRENIEEKQDTTRIIEPHEN